MSVHERYFWALDILNIQPDDEVFEIGCGTGIAAELVAKSLKSGKITAIDRSAAVISRAVKRNQPYIAAGVADFQVATLETMRPLEKSFNKAFAFNVSLFWKNPTRELATIASRLSPQGRIYIFHQPPYEITKEIADQTCEQLEKNNFKVIRVAYKNMQPATVSCVQARLKDNALI